MFEIRKVNIDDKEVEIYKPTSNYVDSENPEYAETKKLTLKYIENIKNKKTYLTDVLKKLVEIYMQDLGDGIALKISTNEFLYEDDCHDDSNSEITIDELIKANPIVLNINYEDDYYNDPSGHEFEVIKPVVEIDVDY